jgi:hypothetical protein
VPPFLQVSPETDHSISGGKDGFVAQVVLWLVCFFDDLPFVKGIDRLWMWIAHKILLFHRILDIQSSSVLMQAILRLIHWVIDNFIVHYTRKRFPVK